MAIIVDDSVHAELSNLLEGDILDMEESALINEGKLLQTYSQWLKKISNYNCHLP